MCSKFQLDDLKTVGEFCDKTFHQQTNSPTTGSLTARLLTPV